MELEEDIVQKGTFLLNTATSCFLCLNTNQGFNGAGESEDRFPLLGISRYLGINLEEFFWNSLREKGLLKGKGLFLGKISNCSVTLCKGCASMTSRLSGLCMELELLRMNFDHCLRAFQEELEYSELDMARVERFRQMQVGNLEGVHVAIAEMLRKKIRKQCDVTLRSVLPKVVISGRTEEPAKRIPFTQKEANPGSLQNQLGTETPDIAEEDFGNELNEDDLEPLSEDGCEQEVKCVNKTDLRTSKLSPKKAPPRKSGSKNRKKGKQMLRKKMKKQCDMKLNSMLPKVVIRGRAEEPNGRIQNTQNATKPVSAQSQLETETPQLAEDDFKNEDGSKSLPEDDCEEKDNSVENNTSVSKRCPKKAPQRKSRSKSRRKGNQLGNTCTLCKPTLKIKEGTLQYHRIRVHMGVLLINYKLPNISPEDFKIYCDHVFKVETLASLKGLSNFKCPYCPVKYKMHFSQRIHLFYEHKEILSKKIIELQKTSTVEDTQAIKLPSLETTVARTSKVGLKTTCVDCHPPEQISVRDFKYHQIRKHPYILMKKYKLPNVSSSDFKTCSLHLLKTEAFSSRKDKDKDGKSICFCPYCTQTYAYHQMLKIHLIYNHEKILGKKLVELQKSKRVGELKKKKLAVIVCSKCGVTVAGRRSLWEHKKFHCKFVQKKKLIKTKALSSQKLDGVGVETPEVSIEVDNAGDEDDSDLKCEDWDGLEGGVGSNLDNSQQQVIMDVDIENHGGYGFVLKAEDYNEDLDAILPGVEEDDK